mmetsp:Transcript_56583/g.136727  ORF Transcript_56583/g.136727 Transcript_56583/m.136727 type:complete len:210 (-) Transcript_56583:33-662(-)
MHTLRAVLLAHVRRGHGHVQVVPGLLVDRQLARASAQLAGVVDCEGLSHEHGAEGAVHVCHVEGRLQVHGQLVPGPEVAGRADHGLKAHVVTPSELAVLAVRVDGIHNDRGPRVDAPFEAVQRDALACGVRAGLDASLPQPVAERAKGRVQHGPHAAGRPAAGVRVHGRLHQRRGVFVQPQRGRGQQEAEEPRRGAGAGHGRWGEGWPG